MPFEQAREYLARVLPWPQEGDEPAFVNVHWTFMPSDGSVRMDPKKGKPILPWSGRACRSLDEAINVLNWVSTRPGTRDIYACLSTQRRAEEKQGRGRPYYKAIRLQENAVALKSLFLDLDAKGTDENSYANLDEAVTALSEFLKASGMPKPSMVVASGGGLHVYWTFAHSLAPYEWQPLAFALAEATKQHGLKCDTQCTIDSARVLRIPDTFNHKSDQPRPVRLAGKRLEFDYSVDVLRKALMPYVVAQPVSPLPPRPPLQGVSDLAAGLDPVKTAPIKLDSLLTQCGFIRDTLATGGMYNTNPLWNLTTLIATFTDNPRHDAHRMGNQHPGYTQDSTDELFDRKEKEKEAKGLGWPSCQTISGSGAKQCQSCPLFSKGKSPIHFADRAVPISPGLPAAHAVTPQVTGFGPVTGSPTPAAAPALTPHTVSQVDLPRGYKRLPTGIVAAVVTDEDGTQEDYPISEYRMEEPWLQKNPWVLHFTTTTERGRTQQVSIPLEHVGTTEMRKILQDQGMMLNVGPKGSENAARFFVAWIKQLQETKESVASSPFGWSVKNGKLEGFVFGGRLWSPAGDIAAANPDTVIARHYAPTGDINVWTDAARLITDQERPDIDAIVASAFAAPLVRFTGHPGVLMSAYSTETGIGKSTALKVAQAVWGDPVKAVQSLSDTYNAVMGKLGEIRSLPLYWDELKTEEDTKKFVNITFQTTQGKEKARMTRSAEQREPGSWQTLLVSASNDSLLDYITQHTNMTEAGLVRVFEYAVRPPSIGGPGQIDTSEAQIIISKLHDNYGQVGLKYAQFLGANHKRVADEVAAFSKELNQKVKGLQDERFWLALITVVCLGAKYANELGLTQFDEEALYDFMVTVLAKMRKERTAQPVNMQNVTNVQNLLTQFLTAMKAKHTLFTNKIHQRKGKPSQGEIRVIGDVSRLDGIYVHVGIEDKLMRVSSTALGEWLRNKKYSRHLFMTALERECGMQKVIGRIGSGTGDPRLVGGTEYLLQIDLNGSPLANFIDEA